MKTFISSITFNNGQDISLNNNDIVVFVGPNNVGKTQALRDMYSLCQRKTHQHRTHTILINELSIASKNTNEIGEKALREGWGTERDSQLYVRGTMFSKNTLEKEITDIGLGQLCNVLVHFSSAGRIQDSSPASTEMVDEEGKTAAILFLADNKELRGRAATGFKRAFGKGLLPNRMAGQSIPICIGDEEGLNQSGKDKFGNEAMDAFKEYLDSLPRINHQSYGIQSFVSTLVNLVLDHKLIFMLDEPETFLHPPQIQVLGQLICENLSDRQAFIATHSQDLIKGLLDVAPERIKIVRITRENDTNTIMTLDNNDIIQLWKDPLLKHSDIINSLFYESVIVCESDADCKMYSVILSDYKLRHEEYMQSLFIPSNGKHRIRKIVDAIRKMGIRVLCIVDIDVLFEKDELKKLTSSFGGEWSIIEPSFQKLQACIDEEDNQKTRKELLQDIENVFTGPIDEYVSKRDVRDIKKIIDTIGRKNKIKKQGEKAIPSDEALTSYKEIESYLRPLGIHIVRVGEIESFFPTVGGHGPKWVANVLEKYNDYSAPEYDIIRAFVSELDV